ncbi:MAG: glycosyltransferase [Actinomycetota bacterium]|nr:glycosyltransferase [Actinomycetota bacterium]
MTLVTPTGEQPSTQRPMRLLQVVPYYPPAWGFGGPPRVMWEEARDLVRRGHRVDVVTTDVLDGEGRVDEGRVDSCEGVQIHRVRNLSNSLAYRHNRFTALGLRRALGRVNADVVHLSELRHQLAIATWREVRNRDLPLVVSAFGSLCGSAGLLGAMKITYDRLWVQPMLRQATVLLATTQHEASGYVAAGGDSNRVEIVPLGTGRPPLPGDPIDLGVPDDAQVLLFLGRIHHTKGIERLITAFKQVAARHPDFYLVVVGRDDGALRGLRDLVRHLDIDGRVRFPGPIYGDRRYDAYRRASLFAITSIEFEETSTASLEAAAVGTPLLVSAEAEVPYLSEYRAGFTLTKDQDLAELLDGTLSADLTEMGKRAKTMIEERHMWTIVGGQIEEILLRAIR